MKANELRQKSVAELNQELIALGKELFNLRIQKAIGETVQSHLFRKAKRNVARIKTILSGKEGS
jgi:large subunit ribosomal protein L29